MKIKRITVGTVAAAVGVLALAGCSSSGSGAKSASSTHAGSSGPAKSANSLKIGYIQTGPFDYYVRGVDGARMAAAKLGVELDVLNSDNKPQTELANVEDALSRGDKGLIIFSVGKSSLQADLAKAKAAKVPAVVLYGYDKSVAAEAVSFVQASPMTTGTQAGEWTATNVKSGDVAIIQGLLGRGDVEAYTAGFKSGLAKNPALKIVSTVTADWDRAKAQSAMADTLTAHPGLKAVFVMNEDMAIGAIAAIKAAGKAGQITVVAQNGSPDGLKALQSGQLAATVAWSPAEEAQMALARLVAYVRDGTAPSPEVCNTPTVVVTRANISAAPPWVPTAASTALGLKAACAR